MSALLKMRDYQEATISALTKDWEDGASRLAVVLPTGAGKSQPLTEPVLTPSGWRTMGDLIVGGQVMSASGVPTTVTGIFPQGVRPMMRMTFSDDSWTDCDPEHLWAVRTKYDKSEGKGYRTLTATQISERVSTDWFIPMTQPVQYPEASLPIDPYLMGVLLGDGGLSVDGRVLITCRNDTAELARAALPSGMTMKHVADAGKDATTWILGAGVGRGANPIMSALREFGLMGTTAWHKFVPEIYLRGSVSQRLALVQGMCDTDGYVEPGKGSVEWTTVSERLAQGMRELANSLGGIAPIRNKKTSWTYLGVRKTSDAFRLQVRLAEGLTPVRVPRKRDVFRPNSKYLPTRRVTSVRPVDPAEAVCIQVATEDHLYVTRHHLVTHNTVVFSHLSSQFVTANGGRRVLILAHTDELVTQAAKKLRDVAPHLKVGIVKAARNEVSANVIVASVQSLRNPARRAMIRNVGLVIVDECHHSVAKTYRDILEHFGCMDVPCGRCANDRSGEPCSDCLGTGLNQGATGRTRTAGFTATLVRGDKGKLSDIWERVSYRKDISFMIRAGYLLPPRGKRIEIEDFDLSKVKKSAGDYQVSALEEALDASLAPATVAKAYVEHAGTRSGILFAPTVDSAYSFAAELVAQGVSAEVVHGALAQEERRAILRRLESGETQVISNCMVLTEGFDSPKVSCIVIARPTRSAGLYQQMVGRGLRPDLTQPREGQDCLILDVVGASAVHGLASLVDLSDKEIKLQDGQSLIEAEDLLDVEEAATAERAGKLIHFGPVTTMDFDPLATASRRVWLKTAGGTYFLSAGTGKGAVYVFIIPATGVDADPGTYDVAWSCKTAYDAIDGKRGGISEHVGITLDLAFAWGEDLADEMGGENASMTLDKSASWRRTKPSEKQLAMCKSAGIVVPEKASKGDVSALIDGRFASKRIDPIVTYFANQNQGASA
jgi:superfamily II DNA or RNA helicase